MAWMNDTKKTYKCVSINCWLELSLKKRWHLHKRMLTCKSVYVLKSTLQYVLNRTFATWYRLFPYNFVNFRQLVLIMPWKTSCENYRKSLHRFEGSFVASYSSVVLFKCNETLNIITTFRILAFKDDRGSSILTLKVLITRAPVKECSAFRTKRCTTTLLPQIWSVL